MSPLREIGPFQVLEKLGAGGMGEVFKARDTRLNRFVALKFLPDMAGDAARERFQREALAIAALNHPHICTLYEVGDDQGRPFLVLELLEGETLKARLRRGALDADQLLDWGVQISDALDAAHRKGVLHRDLKPENIWVAPAGHIKVLDFGLARLEAESFGDDTATSPANLTSPGVAMGTYPYMSPEQARGQALDARSDIFSFGSVFYEMASGTPAFAASSAAEVMAGILKGQPPRLTQALPGFPPMVEQVAERCLEKDPDLRFQSAADLRGELKRLKRESGSISAPVPAAEVTHSAAWRKWRRSAAAIAVALAAVAGWWFLRSPADTPVHLQFRQITFSGHVVDAVISPDGKFLAHVDNGPQGTSLHLMLVANGGDTQVVPASPGCCFSPSFSPDGTTLTFIQNRQLLSVPVLGGAMQKLSDAACSGAAYSPDGFQIAFVVDEQHTMALVRARPDGSQPQRLHVAPLGSGYTSQCWGTVGQPTHAPAWSPDGRWIVLARSQVNQPGQLELVSPSDGHAADLSPDIGFAGSDASWLPDQRALIFAGRIPGNPVAQIWHVTYPGGRLTQLTSDLQGYANASLSASGLLAVVHSAPTASIWVQTHAGGDLQQLPGGGPNQDGAAGLAWSPQGGLVTVRQFGGQLQLWSADPNTGKAQALGTQLVLNGSGLQVAPDGTIVYGSRHETNFVAEADADGSQPRELIRPAPGGEAVFPTLVAGGSAVAYLYLDSQNNQTLWSVPLHGGSPHQLWSGFVFVDGNPASPDGSRIFAINQGPNNSHVPVVVRLDGGTPQVTPVGVDFRSMGQPFGWTPDGRAITYIDHHGTVDNIWAFPLQGGKPYPLTHFTDLNIYAYAFSRDGRLAVSRGSDNSDVAIATGLTGH